MKNHRKIQRSFVLNNKYGIHARPASIFVKTASPFRSEIIVEKKDFSANAKNVLDLMMLAAEPGDQLTVVINGDDAREALAAIEKLFDNNFGE